MSLPVAPNGERGSTPLLAYIGRVAGVLGLVYGGVMVGTTRAEVKQNREEIEEVRQALRDEAWRQKEATTLGSAMVMTHIDEKMRGLAVRLDAVDARLQRIERRFP